LWPGVWFHDDAEHSIWPTAPGKAVSHIAVASAQTYELWLGGSFERGFEVRVDGKPAGRVKDQLSTIDGYIHLADVFLTPGVHTFSFSYPAANLAPGSAGRGLTSLQAIVLQPRTPRSALVRVAPGQASALCGRSLDWIEVVTSS